MNNQNQIKELAQYFGHSKVLAEKQYKYKKPAYDLGEGKFIGILSTYEKMNIGNDCQNIVRHIGKACQAHSEAEFVKLAIFGTHGGLKNSPINCLVTLARECNQQIQNSIDICHKNGRENINFLQTDYPNYLGASLKTVVQIAHDENLKKSRTMDHFQLERNNVRSLDQFQLERNHAKSKLPMSYGFFIIFIIPCFYELM